jgi:hypothetical protein
LGLLAAPFFAVGFFAEERLGDLVEAERFGAALVVAWPFAAEVPALDFRRPPSLVA